jgi:hypothetical protein
MPFTFPVSADTLCLWMADSAEKLRFPSIRAYMHGIATTQMEMGHPNPILQSPLVWRMFKAIKRLQGQGTARKRLPITVSILSQIEPLLDPTNQSHLCMRAAMWLGTCGLLRAGEFTHKPSGNAPPQLQHLTMLDQHDQVLDPLRLNGANPTYMSLRLLASKTDIFRAGTTVIISHPRAIQYMLEYLQARNQHLSRLPLFVGNDGQPLKTTALVSFTQSMIERAHIPNANLFLGHSFRKGGATSLHEAGNPDSLIKTMGRWASFAFATYIHTSLRSLIAAGRSMSKVDHSISTSTLSDSFWDAMD